ncbi:hypothetical protein BJV82DRAFT_184464 [Fennellomyces sp. T-0311]|nr:hypothetical protein BJV82DRAFT_184464 [Fennellomyces sp. T-0311]
MRCGQCRRLPGFDSPTSTVADPTVNLQDLPARDHANVHGVEFATSIPSRPNVVPETSESAIIVRAFKSAANLPLDTAENAKIVLDRLRTLGLTVDERTDGDNNVQSVLCNLLNSFSEKHHSVTIKLEDGVTFVVKGLLAILPIASKWGAKVVVFSSRKNPLRIVPPSPAHLTVAISS